MFVGRKEMGMDNHTVAPTSIKNMVYIVEDAIADAHDIGACGAEAVAVDFTAGTRRLVAEVQSVVRDRRKTYVIVGRNHATNCRVEYALRRAGFHNCFALNLFARSGDAFGAIVKSVDSREALMPYVLKDRSALAHLPILEYEIEMNRNQPPVSSGFAQLDRYLGGGLYPWMYTVGATTSIGKTAFLLQMSDQIAMGGHDVLYFTLEMSETEMMSRSISRLTYLECREQELDESAGKTNLGILDGGRYGSYTPDEMEIIRDARERYKRFAEHLFFIEGNGNMGVAEIRDIVEEYMSVLHTHPVVIIDYLQLLAPFSERMSDKQSVDKNIDELKLMSRDLRIPLFLISSYNRGSYQKDADESAYKESGKIEYGSDVLIALQLQGMDTEGFNPKVAKKSVPRYIEAVIVKSRNGYIGQKVRIEYNPKYHYMREMREDEKPCLPGTLGYANETRDNDMDKRRYAMRKSTRVAVSLGR